MRRELVTGGTIGQLQESKNIGINVDENPLPWKVDGLRVYSIHDKTVRMYLGRLTANVLSADRDPEQF